MRDIRFAHCSRTSVWVSAKMSPFQQVTAGSVGEDTHGDYFYLPEIVIRKFKEKVMALSRSRQEGGPTPAQNAWRAPARASGKSLSLALVPAGLVCVRDQLRDSPSFKSSLVLPVRNSPERPQTPRSLLLSHPSCLCFVTGAASNNPPGEGELWTLASGFP